MAIKPWHLPKLFSYILPKRPQWDLARWKPARKPLCQIGSKIHPCPDKCTLIHHTCMRIIMCMCKIRLRGGGRSMRSCVQNRRNGRKLFVIQLPCPLGSNNDTQKIQQNVMLDTVDEGAIQETIQPKPTNQSAILDAVGFQYRNCSQGMGTM